jgi:hypothetical protein
MRKLHYLVRINKDLDSDWGASVLDLPGCVATGKTIDVKVQTVCIHGDSPGADKIVAAVRDGLVKAGAVVKPLRDWFKG